MSNKEYLIMWDEYGLDSLVDVSGRRSAYNMGVMAGKPAKELPHLNELQYMHLRARQNGQRCYEIYFLKCDEDILEDDIQHMFDTNPQTIVDLIREKGVKLYSQRNFREPVIR